MRKNMLFLCLFTILCATAQTPLHISEAKFVKSDNTQYRTVNYNDSKWSNMPINQLWKGSDKDNARSYGWYRIRFTMPEAFITNSNPLVSLDLGRIDDADETYLNGTLIGKTGRMPADKGGYASAWSQERRYTISRQNLKQDNILAIRVYNDSGEAGIRGNGISISLPSMTDGIKLSSTESATKARTAAIDLTCSNTFPVTQKGRIQMTLKDVESGKTLKTIDKSIALKANDKRSFSVTYPVGQHVHLYSTFTGNDGKTVNSAYSPKYILTPPAPLTPRYNGALVFGVRPESPVIFRMAFSGEKPLHYSVKGLPDGLTVDEQKGVISGTLQKRGDYEMTLVAENAKGKVEQPFTIKVGDKIALTPPMGWNSWNCWGLSVSQDKVKSSAQAILDKGLADFGYSYVNIDDAWEAAQRNPDGTIAVNKKFSDMKKLGDWLHSNGLRFGIYSSPGDRTCGGYLGSLGHEQQDAETYNSWGIDYLKYDWCGYSHEFDSSKDHTQAAYVWPYLHMERYLRQQPRDIFYSLCQYGMADVWKWGTAVDANSWRTTGDITDSWESLYEIGFNRQNELYPYAGPGHWNDPDMLIVGKVGWGDNLRNTRLTPDEQYTHISLWSLLAANMLIGCDVAQMDDFTLNLLCNNEVNAVSQDILGKQAKCDVKDGYIQIWRRPLADGSFALGIFNLGDSDTDVNLAKYLAPLNINKLTSIRDLWRQADLSTTDVTYPIVSHGVKFLKIHCE